MPQFADYVCVGRRPLDPRVGEGRYRAVLVHTNATCPHGVSTHQTGGEVRGGAMNQVALPLEQTGERGQEGCGGGVSRPDQGISIPETAWDLWRQPTRSARLLGRPKSSRCCWGESKFFQATGLRRSADHDSLGRNQRRVSSHRDLDEPKAPQQGCWSLDIRSG